MPTKKKIIRVPLANIEKMAVANKVSKVTVYNALAYRTHSELAQGLRKQAVEFYGGIQSSTLIFD
jgi:hypothetical protein